MKRGPPPGALRSGPNVPEIEVGLAKLEDRVRDVEIGQRSDGLDHRDLADIRRRLSALETRVDGAISALAAAAVALTAKTPPKKKGGR